MEIKERNYDIWGTYGLMTTAKTEYNLIESYKRALKNGNEVLEWDKGIINIFDVSAVIER
ncbi:hypothetical protein [Paraliobacillus ryukyuensis]|uniref:hypothetical protein n=1 Tax=Paraliobacillus ryukyuensis TaxID=200904 RepID=UPI0009A83A1C|nr:hypothetical protein [Paraliobacillus ryukyuensis]